MEFDKWPSTPRLFKDCVVTEKIDGTNACVVIERVVPGSIEFQGNYLVNEVTIGDDHFRVFAQSRNRFVTPENDNAGFAKWVYERSEELVTVLGEGHHFGEWFGKGIQRNYGLETKQFALFNSHRWGFLREIPEVLVSNLTVVPVLYQGPFDTMMIRDAYDLLMMFGSIVVPDFMKPEGVIIYHTASKQYYKMTDQGDVSKFARGGLMVSHL